MKVSNIRSNLYILLLAGLGGGLLSLTGLNVGWLVGATMITGLFNLAKNRPTENSWSDRFYPFWKQSAQVIIALQVSAHISGTTLGSLKSGWPAILTMLLLTLLFSILFGLIFCKISGTDLMTGLYALTPGGVSTIPSLSQEAGANPALVSSVHVLRTAMVTSMVPLLASFLRRSGLGPIVGNYTSQMIIEPLYETSLYETIEFLHAKPFGWTLALVLSALVGSRVARKLRFPAPLLVGGILGAAFLQMGVSFYANFTIVPWLPQWLRILAQVLLGASLGTKINREMFLGAGRALLMGALSITGLLIMVTGCSYMLFYLTGIPLITSLLSFAPGSVAEMAATSTSMKADSSFVIASQTLRLILIYTLLPLLINRIAHKRKSVDHV